MSTPKVFAGVTSHLDLVSRMFVAAKYSRSLDSVMDRLPKTEEEINKHKDSTKEYAIKYGHKSILQMAEATVYFEGVSMLAAKALENHALVNAQESSTRYIDFTSQPMCNDTNTAIKEVQIKCINFFNKILPITIEKLKKEFPIEENSNVTEKVYNNTIKARAFDLTRGYIPAGMTTNVAISATFDTLNDHLGSLLHHPLDEISSIALEALNELKVKFPDAVVDPAKLYTRFAYKKHNFNNEDYNNAYFYSLDPKNHLIKNFIDEPLVIQCEELDYDYNYTREKEIIKHFLTNRNLYQNLPREISSLVKVNIRGNLDFGSYRDIHRHRNGVISMVVLNPLKGIFHPYYSNHLSDELKEESNELLEEIETKYKYLKSSRTKEVLQYMIPMGYTIPFEYKCDLNQLIYLFELRGSKTVHNTLRNFINKIYRTFEYSTLVNHHLKIKRDELKINVDLDEDNFTFKRGTQA